MSKKRFQKVYIEITNVCNLKCKFCPEGNRKKEFIEVENFRYILEDVKNYTDLICLHIKGEPLLHPKLNELLEECDKIGIKVNITTNATLLLKNVGLLCNHESIRQINISLHSLNQNDITKENAEKYLTDVMQAVRLIHSNTEIIISYRLWNIFCIGQNEKNKQIIDLLEAEYNVQSLMEKTKENSFVKLENNIFLNQDVQFEWLDINREVISEEGKCYGIREQIGILVNGDVVPCCLDQNGDINLGNIYNNSLNEILNGELANKIINGFESHKIIHPLCKRCGYKIRFGNK